MREFVYGTADQYRKLDQALSSGKNYRFPNRRLPRTCTPETACLWFGKVNGSYRLCIDKGIRATEGSDEFMRFLERGEATFATMDSMTSFLFSLQPLFQNDVLSNEEEQLLPNSNLPLRERSCSEPTHGQNCSVEPVIDKNRLNQIRAERRKPKTVWPEELAEQESVWSGYGH